MKKFISVLAVLCLTATAFAQVKGSSFYIGGNLSAKPGPMIGYKYQFELPVKGLGVIVSADFTYAPLKKSVREQAEISSAQRAESMGYENDSNRYGSTTADVKHRNSQYFTLPVNVGANYCYSFGKVGVWAEAAFGVAGVFNKRSVWKGESHTVEDFSSDITDKHYNNTGERHYYDITRYNPAFAFAWKTGVGAMFGKTLSLGLEINGIGAHKVKVIQKIDDKPYWNSSKGASVTETKGKYAVGGHTCVALRLGFHF